ncbi:MAG: hypothetical protein JWL69_1573 [Phycisphaerales bacterium]|nr:hypothetical protein [Phycisphaerales bacterium]
MSKRKESTTGLLGLLNGPQVRRVQAGDQVLYGLEDVIRLLAESSDPRSYWAQMVETEPQLAGLAIPAEFAGPDGTTQPLEAVSFEGILRLVQSIPSPRCERIKTWLAGSARQRLEEAQNPELVALRARRLYEQQGYNRRWVDKRLRGISARHEITSEWRQRGAEQSDDYRALTNELLHSAFGMDVEGYRRYKNLLGSTANLRDHMTDLELALTSLGETTAVALHQARSTRGLDRLVSDVKDAGQVVARTLEEIERQTGGHVVTPENAGSVTRRRRPQRPGSGSPAGSAKERTDEKNENRASRRGAGDGSPAEGDAGSSRARRSPDRGGPKTARRGSKG